MQLLLMKIKVNWYSASYTMGGMTLAGASNDVENIAGTSTRDNEGYEFTLSFAF